MTTAGGVVQVWHSSVTLPPATVVRLAAVLSSDEQARAARFHFARDRQRFIVARGILRHSLARYLAVDPAMLRFIYGAHGKPALAGVDLPFNLAHSADRVVVALGGNGPLGVDQEWVRPIPDAAAIAAYYFTPGEVAELHSLPPEQFPVGFYNAWTRKEAFLKAVGSGLAVPLNAVAVSLRPDAPAILRRVPEDQAAVGWQLYNLELHPDYRAALVVAGPAPLCRPWPGLAEF